MGPKRVRQPSSNDPRGGEDITPPRRMAARSNPADQPPQNRRNANHPTGRNVSARQSNLPSIGTEAAGDGATPTRRNSSRGVPPTTQPTRRSINHPSIAAEAGRAGRMSPRARKPVNTRSGETSTSRRTPHKLLPKPLASLVRPAPTTSERSAFGKHEASPRQMRLARRSASKQSAERHLFGDEASTSSFRMSGSGDLTSPVRVQSLTNIHDLMPSTSSSVDGGSPSNNSTSRRNEANEESSPVTRPSWGFSSLLRRVSSFFSRGGDAAAKKKEHETDKKDK